MRGTCSPGFKLESTGPEEQIIPGAFADSSAQSMVPYSHILWASLWWGIAADAVARAAEFVRASARKNPGTVPPTATRLADVSTQLQSARHNSSDPISSKRAAKSRYLRSIDPLVRTVTSDVSSSSASTMTKSFSDRRRNMGSTKTA